MAATPDADTVRQAYAKLSELGRQELTWSMIFKELRHAGYSDDVIAAATKERFDLEARAYKKGSARILRAALVMFVLGLIAWPITSLFDLGFLETGMLFGLFGGSVLVAGRGVWNYLTARRRTLTEDQVMDFVTKGEVLMPHTGATPSPDQVSTLADPTDQLEDARSHAEAAKRVKNAILTSQVVVFIIGFVLISASISDRPIVTIFLGLPLFFFVLGKVTPFVVGIVENWVEHGTEAFAAPGPSLTGKNIILTEVPRAPNLPIPSDEDVIRAEHLATPSPTPTSSGGRTLETDATGDEETTIESDLDLLPPGVLVFTGEGLIFYPNFDSTGDLFKDVASTVLAVASPSTAITQVAVELGILKALETEIPALPLWLRQAREHKHHFVIPWPELVRVFYNPIDRRVTLVRQVEDGSLKVFRFSASTDEWPEALMSIRFKYEMLATMREFVELPRMREALPELVEKFRGIYGERVEDHWPEIVREAEEQVNQQQMGDAVEVIVTNLADRLPCYGRYPKLRALYTPLFPDEPSEDADGKSGETETPTDEDEIAKPGS
ncbi:MAG: hypothetical protein AAGF48_09155 [Pseudomonadota bacterium]